MAKADEDRSSKPIDPSSLPIIEALAGKLVATVFEYAQLNTVTPKVLNDAWTLTHQRLGIAQIEGTNRNDPPAPELDAATTTAATAQEIWTMYKELVGADDLFLLNIAALPTLLMLMLPMLLLMTPPCPYLW